MSAADDIMAWGKKDVLLNFHLIGSSATFQCVTNLCPVTGAQDAYEALRLTTDASHSYATCGAKADGSECPPDLQDQLAALTEVIR